ncbi:hypothetical protein XA68_15600 [Ophiocordyceps unilateralis]|uniref:Uncharacterized protein n=1 Tax=Ophiocordyceps unilateralis TaxID=268505 RepID=A0A2A9P6S6_OPHUN|nr:hypothetical protein XA68_15600 [Ophiocordyceps unilateralis]
MAEPWQETGPGSSHVRKTHDDDDDDDDVDGHDGHDDHHDKDMSKSLVPPLRRLDTDDWLALDGLFVNKGREPSGCVAVDIF